MHGAAKSLAQPVFPAVKFSHHFSWGRPEHDGLPMATITGNHEIRGIPRRQRADYGRFRAIGKMGMSAHRARVFEESALHMLLELTNAHHLCVDPDQPIVSELFSYEGH